MNHGDTLSFGSLWLLHQPAQVVQVARQQHGRLLHYQRCRRHHGVYGAAMTGKASRSKQFAGRRAMSGVTGTIVILDSTRCTAASRLSPLSTAAEDAARGGDRRARRDRPPLVTASRQRPARAVPVLYEHSAAMAARRQPRPVPGPADRHPAPVKSARTEAGSSAARARRPVWRGRDRLITGFDQRVRQPDQRQRISGRSGDQGAGMLLQDRVNLAQRPPAVCSPRRGRARRPRCPAPAPKRACRR